MKSSKNILVKNKVSDKFFRLLLNIPQGKVTTYKIIADKLNISPRYVGYLLHQNKSPKKYPCHRVVRSNGSLAIGYAFGGESAQKRLLIKEGVVFYKNRVLKKHLHNF